MKRVYECPKCGQRVSLGVTPSEPPKCSHGGKTKPLAMVEVDLTSP